MKNNFTNTVWFWNLLLLGFGAVGVWAGFALSNPEYIEYLHIQPLSRLMLILVQIISFMAVGCAMFVIIRIKARKTETE